MAKNLHGYRKSYERGSLDVDTVLINPMEQFEKWFHEAEASEDIMEPNAMTLSTIGVDGFPKGRVVLLKEFNEEGFVFYTNYASEKGRSIQENPNVCISFFWPELERQITIKGMASKISEEKSKSYFEVRPRKSQLGALVSSQSQPIENRLALEEKLTILDASYKGKEVPKPAHWGGYQIVPCEIEFWQGRRSRLHDRILFVLTGGGGWNIKRLQP